MAQRTSRLSITPELLLRAYAAGLFPMAESQDDPALFWLDPDKRGIIPLDGLTVSRSLRKVVRSDRFRIEIDRNFEAVIEGCAGVAPGRASTWINGTIRRLYREVFEAGAVHTVEAYRNGMLVGGLYGVAIGGAFFGESMFHRETDASKVCLVHLAARLVDAGFTLLDAQFVTPHLATLGAVEIPRDRYRTLLAHALALPATFPRSTAVFSGDGALARLASEDCKPAGSVDQRPAGSLPPNSDE